jgi:hypothetical protein
MKNFNFRENSMRNTIAVAAVAALLAGSAMAGGFAQEVVEEPVAVVEPVAETSSWGIIIPLAALALLIALASSSEDEPAPPA